MLFILALIPVVVLLIFIYFKDKKEKEPIGLLIGLFFGGAATVITALIGEGIGQAILNAIMPYESVIKGIVLSILVIGPSEELGKYLVLRLITWKNKNYNYSFDAIVYAVFVSLGFACIENIFYVVSNGVGTAFLRMFTSVPGHACFAVFMGFFYSKAKYAKLTNDKGGYAKNNALSMIVPILLHGTFDAIIFGGRAAEAEILTGLSLLMWLGYVIVLLVVSFIAISNASKNDFCIVMLPQKVQTVYRPSVVGTWTCSCGVANYLNFCSKCGKPRPTVTTWTCPKCGTLATLRFCGHCGCPNPAVPSPAAQSPAPMQAGPYQSAPVQRTPVQNVPYQPAPGPMQGAPSQPGPYQPAPGYHDNRPQM